MLTFIDRDLFDLLRAESLGVRKIEGVGWTVTIPFTFETMEWMVESRIIREICPIQPIFVEDELAQFETEWGERWIAFRLDCATDTLLDGVVGGAEVAFWGGYVWILSEARRAVYHWLLDAQNLSSHRQWHRQLMGDRFHSFADAVEQFRLADMVRQGIARSLEIPPSQRLIPGLRHFNGWQHPARWFFDPSIRRSILRISGESPEWFDLQFNRICDLEVLASTYQEISRSIASLRWLPYGELFDLAEKHGISIGLLRNGDRVPSQVIPDILEERPGALFVVP